MDSVEDRKREGWIEQRTGGGRDADKGIITFPFAYLPVMTLAQWIAAHPPTEQRGPTGEHTPSLITLGKMRGTPVLNLVTHNMAYLCISLVKDRITPVNS